jgi:hypothetical protein
MPFFCLCMVGGDYWLISIGLFVLYLSWTVRHQFREAVGEFWWVIPAVFIVVAVLWMSVLSDDMGAFDDPYAAGYSSYGERLQSNSGRMKRR